MYDRMHRMGNNVTIIGMWEPGFSEYEQIIEWRIWKQTLAAYQVDRWIMIGDVVGGSFETFDSIDSALHSINSSIILLEPWNGVPLKEFEHPINATYIFGNAVSNLEKYRDLGQSVNIPTPKPVDMFAAACVSVVLNDRYSKL